MSLTAADKAVRDQAEATIKNVCAHPFAHSRLQAAKLKGFLPFMLQITADPSVSLLKEKLRLTNTQYKANRKVDVSQAASIQLKNVIDNNWRFKDLEHAKKFHDDGMMFILIDEQDKEYIRQNLLKVMAATSEEKIL